MHETSIARRLIALAEEVARRHPGRPLAVVRVRVGAFQSVVPDALRFAFVALKAGTACEFAELVLTEIPLVIRCPTCGDHPLSVADFSPFCPDCGGVAEIVSGTELELESVDLGD